MNFEEIYYELELDIDESQEAGAIRRLLEDIVVIRSDLDDTFIVHNLDLAEMLTQRAQRMGVSVKFV